MRPFRILLIFVVAALMETAIPTHAAPAVPWPTNGWQTSTPEEQGMDSSMLASLFADFSNFHSMLVIRHGYVVLDASVHPFNSSETHALFSVTKSFLSTLVGIAIDKGYLKSVDQSIWDFLPKDKTANMDANKARITIGDLLTHRSGIGLTLLDDAVLARETTKDWVQTFLDKPMTAEPGTTFFYLNANPLVLSAILQKATGKTTQAFAEEVLFGPLGITRYHWAVTPQGINVGGTELFLSAQDMAKLGYLYLHNGQWNGKQIVSADWVKAGTSNLVPETGYGYLWWFLDLKAARITGYSAQGLGGQEIYVLPGHDLVIVFTGDEGTENNLATGQVKTEQVILPAAKSDKALPANPDGAVALKTKLQALANPVPKPITPVPDNVKRVLGQTYLLKDNRLGWKSIRLDMTAQETVLTLVIQDQTLKLPVGMDDLYRVTTPGLPTNPDLFRLVGGSALAVKGRWTGPTFRMTMLDMLGREIWGVALNFATANEVMLQAALSGPVRDEMTMAGDGNLLVAVKGKAQ